MDKTQNTVTLFNRYAERYQEKYMDQAAFRAALQRFVALLPSGDTRLLDIACGPGNVTKYLLEQRPSAQVIGIDLAERMLILARQTNPTADFQCLDARRVGELPTGFSGIICAFLLPYLSRKESVQFLHDAAARLSPGGALYLSTMEGHPDDSGWQGPSSGGDGEKMYIYYHQADYLLLALQESGMIVRFTQRIAPEMDGGDSDFVIVAQKEK